MWHRGRNHTQYWRIFLCLIVMLPLASCVMPQEPASGTPYSSSRTADIQYENITSALPEEEPIEPQEEESAVSLAQKIKEDPLGKHGYYTEPEAVMISTPAEIAPPPAPMETAQTADTVAVDPVMQSVPASTPPPPGATGEPLTRAALLLPLTGEATSMARSVQNAAELAVQELQRQNLNITIIPIDTKGTEGGAQLALEKAVDENVDIILGPMFSETTRAIANTAKERGIPLVSFSNDITLTEEEVYVFGYNPREQVQRVVEYAYSQGIREFALLAPEGEFGDAVSDEIKESLKRRNIRASRMELYESTGEDLSPSIQRLTFIDPSLPPPKPRSEALVIPEGGRNLLTLVARLYRRGIQNEHFQLLGTMAWDNEVVIGEPRLEGSWFATTSPLKQNKFNNLFRDSFGYEPIQISSLGYDAVMLAATVAKQAEDARFTEEAMQDVSGFVGADNLFRFNREKIAERTLSVVEIQNGRLEVLDPAPTVFPATLR